VISVLEGWKLPKTKPNLKLREELDQKNVEELYFQLLKLDKKRAENIDKRNKRRLIRALEIVIQNEVVEPLAKKPIKADILILGIKKDREEIKQLILERLNRRINAGMIEEVRKLKDDGVTSQRLNDLGLEYRYLNLYLEGKLNLKEMKEQLYIKICQFAKRQMTWFKKFNNVF
jgi:tRNA dimethylallyltransferase